VHAGWTAPDESGRIPYEKSFAIMGGHAFAIVAHDEYGFWMQNSWGSAWGLAGFAQVSYDDWLVNGADVWVARLGVPVSLRFAEAAAVNIAPGVVQAKSYSFADLHPHIISFGEAGLLNVEETYASSEAEVAEVFRTDLPRLTQGWERKRLLLYAHAGLVNDKTFIQRVAEYRVAFLQSQVYPLVFLWHTDFWSTVTTILQDALRRRRPDGAMNGRLDFMLDRLDDTLEPLVRSLMGRVYWEAIKQKAYQATTNEGGGGRVVLKYLSEWMHSEANAEVHVVAHSAGSIFIGHLVRLLTAAGPIKRGALRGATGYGLPVTSCTLWAPAINIDEFKRTYLPALQDGSIQRFALYTLSDEAEQDDHCAQIYHKSLLYLISNALEAERGQPLLGLEKCVQADHNLASIFEGASAEWVRAPNDAPKGSRWASTARRHNDFDDDPPTLRSTLARILHSKEELPEFNFQSSEASLREKRIQLESMTD
jgi:hypothetical protein